MKMTIVAAAALLTAAALASPVLAQPKPAAPDQCFSHSRIRATLPVDNSTINARVDKDIWQIKMKFPCPMLGNSRRGYILKLHTGGDRICKPIDLDITVNDPNGGECLVGSFRKLSPAEVAALPKRQIPSY